MNVESLVRNSIKDLKPYSSARDEFVGDEKDMVFLDANENPFDTDINRYPDPYQNNVKEVLSELKCLPIKNMLLGNGSDEVLDLVFRAFCEPGIDNVISLPPTYGMYSVLADINNIEVREVPLIKEIFQPDVEKILESADACTKLLFLCSPNNPTGNSFSSDRIEYLLKNFKGIVVIDEAYIDFSAQESYIAKLKEYDNLIITQTLSKAYGMAGIRLGVCYASEYIISILNKIKPPYNVNVLTQERAVKRLLNYSEVEIEVGNIIRERNNLSRVLNEFDFIEKIYESDTNFLLVIVDDANLRYKQLLDLGIVVRNRTTQLNCTNCLRFSIGTPEENINLINNLKTL